MHNITYNNILTTNKTINILAFKRRIKKAMKLINRINTNNTYYSIQHLNNYILSLLYPHNVASVELFTPTDNINVLIITYVINGRVITLLINYYYFINSDNVAIVHNINAEILK